MNFNFKVGCDTNENDVFLDLQKENLHTIVLTGQTGSGKGMFHGYIYKQLIEQNFPEELGFVFMDMTRVDFAQWDTPYLYFPTIVDPDLALRALEELGGESVRRLEGKSDAKRAIIIHIEECDMMCRDGKKFEKAWLNIAKGKARNNMYIIFSSSRPSADVFTKTILDNADLKIVCRLSSLADSSHVLGKSCAEKFTHPGQKVLAYKNNELLLAPFTATEVEEIQKFECVMNP